MGLFIILRLPFKIETMSYTTIIAHAITRKVIKRSIRKATLSSMGAVLRTNFVDGDVKTWVESPDIGRNGSAIAGEISLEAATTAVGEKFPGNGKDKDFRTGGEVVIIPKDSKYNFDLCEIDGENFTFKRRGEVVSAAATSARKKGIVNAKTVPSETVVEFDWEHFIGVVNKHSHPGSPGEWDGYVAQIYAWVQGGNRAMMKRVPGGGKMEWTPAPLRPDEKIPDDEKCEVVEAALKALDYAHTSAGNLRRKSVKRSAKYWNEIQRREGSLWEKGSKSPIKPVLESDPEPTDPVSPAPTVAAIRPPTLLRSTSLAKVCEEYDAVAAAEELEEDHRHRDERDLVDIMG